MPKKIKIKTRIKYVERQALPTVDEEKKAKEEIERLETLKQKNIEAATKAKEGRGRFGRLLTGFQYGLARGGINKQISQQQNFLKSKQAVRNIKSAVEFEKTKSELSELRKKNVVSYDNLFGEGKPSGTKQVKWEDLY